MNQQIIAGERIYLRSVCLDDVNQNYYEWLIDKEVNQFLETRFVPHSLEAILEFVKKFDGNANEILLAICLKDSGRHIGNIKLGPINWHHRHADVGLLIGDKQYWGRGFATEAIHLMTSYAFNHLNLHKLKAGCYQENKGSARAFIKNGYIQEGLLKEQFYCQDQYTDALIFGITRHQFQDQQK